MRFTLIYRAVMNTHHWNDRRIRHQPPPLELHLTYTPNAHLIFPIYISLVPLCFHLTRTPCTLFHSSSFRFTFSLYPHLIRTLCIHLFYFNPIAPNFTRASLLYFSYLWSPVLLAFCSHWYPLQLISPTPNTLHLTLYAHLPINPFSHTFQATRPWTLSRRDALQNEPVSASFYRRDVGDLLPLSALTYTAAIMQELHGFCIFLCWFCCGAYFFLSIYYRWRGWGACKISCKL